MSSRITIDLPKPLPPGEECLPHAAMSLGAAPGPSAAPRRLVHRLVLEEHLGCWVLYRMDEGGGFIADTWHGSREDALHQIRKEFGIEPAL